MKFFPVQEDPLAMTCGFFQPIVHVLVFLLMFSESEPDVISTDTPDMRSDSSSVEVCELGVTFCGHHKHCYIPKHSKSRQGICRCDKGYKENDTGNCVESVSVDNNHSQDSTTTTTTTETVRKTTVGFTSNLEMVSPTPKNKPQNVTPPKGNTIVNGSPMACIWPFKLFGIEQSATAIMNSKITHLLQLL